MHNRLMCVIYTYFMRDAVAAWDMLKTPAMSSKWYVMKKLANQQASMKMPIKE